MAYIRKIPFIMSASSAVIAYAISNKMGLPIQEIYFRMTVSIVVFFILGLYVRSSIDKIVEDIERKKKEILEQELISELEKNSGVNMAADENDNTKTKAQKIDYSIDSDDFSPLKVSDYIKTKKD